MVIRFDSISYSVSNTVATAIYFIIVALDFLPGRQRGAGTIAPHAEPLAKGSLEIVGELASIYPIY